jgi:transcriptional regulator with XRE-family HTH domain
MDIQSKERLSVLVKEARGNMTKSAFAEMLGVSHTAVGSWEQGSFMPDVKSLVKISSILGLSVEELLIRIEGKHISSKSFDLNRMINQINSMPQKQVALLGRAVSDRLYAIAESVG